MKLAQILTREHAVDQCVSRKRIPVYWSDDQRRVVNFETHESVSEELPR